MTTVALRNDRSPADVLTMHQCGPGGRCWVCSEAFPCTKSRKMLKAYFMHHLWDLGPFLKVLANQCATNPAFRHMTTEALHAHFADWAEPLLRQQQQVEAAAFRARQEVERAALAASTGAQRAIARAVGNISSWFHRQRDSRLTDGNGRRPVMGQPARGVVRFGAVRDGEKVEALAGDRG